MHTPGPWKFNGHERVLPVEGAQDGTNDICHVYGINHDRRANARLIAAAPDLLEAVEKFLEDADDRDEVIDPETGEAYEDFKQLRAAVTKAKGA